MIRVTKHGVGRSETLQQPQASQYVLAGQSLVFQTEVPELDVFKQTTTNSIYDDMLSHVASPLDIDYAEAQTLYQGNAPFAGQDRQIKVLEEQNKLQVNIDGMPLCHIDLAKDHVHFLNDKPYGEQLNLEVLFGPVMALLLLRHGIYCLHSSAVKTAAGSVGLLAESDLDKSTLSQNIDSSWTQIADDVIPVMRDEQCFKMLDFPQLKLENNCAAYTEVQPIKLDYLLKLEKENSSEIVFQELSRSEGLLQIIRHTMAAKLFNQEQIKAHASFARKLSAVIPVISISYPRDIEKIGEVRSKIVNYLRELS